MTEPVHGYLSDLDRRLHLERSEREEILREFRVHVEDRAQDLVEAGFSSNDALAHAVSDLGDSHDIASELYEVQSRGSWYHTVLAVIPHLLISLMFALHLWTTPGWVVFMIVVAAIISVIGWKKGRPRWTYPWLGYCLIAPIVSWGLAVSAVGYGAWGVVTGGSLPLTIPIYAASFAYFAVSLWLVIRFVSRVARPDWVMASLAILPVPFLAYWFFYFYNSEAALEPTNPLLLEVDSTVSVVFLIVAASTAVFFRIGRRLVRVALLMITAPSMTVLAWLSYQGGPDHVAVFAIAVVSLAILLIPAFFDFRESRDRGHALGGTPEGSPG
jgi:hypothetical protein